jgi:hypothetical protein
MPLWDAVAMGLAGSGTNPEFNGVPLINNSYNCYVGSVLAFYIGEGRVTAIYGGETKLVFDWESVLLNLLDWGGNGPLGKLETTRKLMGGGDTTLVLGPTNKLNYYGSDLAVNRARDEFKMTWTIKVPDTSQGAAAGAMKDITKTEAIPAVIKCILALGFIGILSAALLLRYWWGFYGISSSKPQTEQEQLASVLIPMFEGLWLSLLYAVEAVNGGLTGLANGVLDSLTSFFAMAASGAVIVANGAAYPFVQLGQFLYSGVEYVADFLTRLAENASQNSESMSDVSGQNAEECVGVASNEADQEQA